MSVRTSQRRARRSRPCDGCGKTIPRDATYLEHRASPHTPGLDNPTWVAKSECLTCAGRAGRREDQAPEDFMVPLFDAEAIA